MLWSSGYAVAGSAHGMHPRCGPLSCNYSAFFMKNQLFSGLLIAALFSAFPASSMPDDDLIELYELTSYEKKMLKGIARRDEAVGSMINFTGAANFVKKSQGYYDMSNSTIKYIAKKLGGSWPGRIVPISPATSYMAWFGWQIEAWHHANKGILKIANARTCQDLGLLWVEASSNNTDNEKLWKAMRAARGC